MEVTINDSQVQEALQKVIDNVLPEAVEEAMLQGCLAIENEAKDRCPVDSGQLRGSIQSQVEQFNGIVYTNVEYAPYVELGTGIYSSQGNGRMTPWTYKSADGTFHTTSGQHPQPFMVPALEAKRGDIIKYFEGLL